MPFIVLIYMKSIQGFYQIIQRNEKENKREKERERKKKT